jgi:hypothetical protein
VDAAVHDRPTMLLAVPKVAQVVNLSITKHISLIDHSKGEAPHDEDETKHHFDAMLSPFL